MNEATDTRAGRQRQDRLPRNRQRERVLAMVREHDGGIDAVELASQMGLHVTTVRFHLDGLCDEDVIVRTRINRPGRGRPRTGYRAVGARVDYRALAEVLAMELGRTEETRARRAQHAGHKWAARIASPRAIGIDVAEDASHADDVDALDRAAMDTTATFAGMGFAPELAATAEPRPSSAESGSALGAERIIRLHACPVRELARSRPEVVCAIHLGLLQGLVDKSPAGGEGGPKSVRPAMTAHLEPLVEPDLCVARLVAG
ncbi:transcriptional regulator [Mycobacterium angelicum]|nr:transcriptional regulator [Mycobacterium angelicum]